MAKKQARVTSVAGLSSIPVTPVKTNGYESSAELWNRLQQEEREAQAASERQKYLDSPEGKLDTALQQNDVTLRKFWSQPFSELREFEIRHFPVDVIGDYTATTQGDNVDGDRVILGDFLDGLSARGITFPEDGDGLRPGMLRFFKYVTSLRRHHNVGMTPENLMQALQQLVYRLRAFEPNAGELSGTVPVPEWLPKPQAASQETEAQRRARLIEEGIENVDTSTRAGQAKAIGILDGLWGRDVRNRYRDFAEFMDKQYNVDVLTPKICLEFGAFCDRWNLNPLDKKGDTLNAWRRELDRRRIFATSLLTKDEKLAMSIENSDLSDREVRMNIARRTHDINGR